MPVATGLDGPVGFTFTPSGRLVYVERNTGWIRFRNLQTGTDRRVYRVTNINFDGERGALGVELHPNWPTSRFVYVRHAEHDGGAPQRGAADPSRRRHRRGRPQDPVLGGRPGVQPQRRPDPLRTRSQALRRDRRQRAAVQLPGPLRQLPRRSSAEPRRGDPRDQPVRHAGLGLRDPQLVGFGFDPANGRLWESENGPECNDEVNRIVRGGNHGWGPSETVRTRTTAVRRRGSFPSTSSSTRWGSRAWRSATRAGWAPATTATSSSAR